MSSVWFQRPQRLALSDVFCSLPHDKANSKDHLLWISSHHYPYLWSLYLIDTCGQIVPPEWWLFTTPPELPLASWLPLRLVLLLTSLLLVLVAVVFIFLFSCDRFCVAQSDESDSTSLPLTFFYELLGFGEALCSVFWLKLYLYE